MKGFAFYLWFGGNCSKTPSKTRKVSVAGYLFLIAYLQNCQFAKLQIAHCPFLIARFSLPLAICLSLLLNACTRESFSSDVSLRLFTSADTLRFDTVFVSSGSVVQSFKLFNPNRDGIRNASISLGGGAASPFRINVGGVPGPAVGDVEIRGEDSLYVFVTLTAQPNGVTRPFVLQDSIEINYNGNRQWVQLQAYGQNARFLRNANISTNTDWDSTLPYVIFGRLTVASGATLRMGAGTRLYFHAGASLRVEGSLRTEGTSAHRILFTGNRLDEPYRNLPGSWGSIHFTPGSTANALRYTDVYNAYQGMVVEEGVTIPAKLSLQEVRIQNCFDAGLMATGASIDAQNLLVAASPKGIQLFGGGNYSFVHTTLAGFANPSILRRDPLLFISNTSASSPTPAPLSLLLRNSIVWGEDLPMLPNEVVTDRTGTLSFSLILDRVLWRQQTPPTGATVSGAFNSDPLYDTVLPLRNLYNFRLHDASPALNAGSATSIATDLDGAPRPVGLPDLGAYEKQ